ncbi:MAG: hypothetical protein U0559_13435 [Anaerolineae bacterium]
MLSDIIAGIALILSIISLYLQWKDKQPHLRISPSVEIKPLPIVRDQTGGFSSRDTLVLTVYLANSSEKTVHVTGIYLSLPKGKLLQLDSYPGLEQGRFSPFSVEPFRGYAFTVWGKKVAKILHENSINGNVQAKIMVQDEMQKIYTSRKLRFSIQQLVDNNLPSENSA